MSILQQHMTDELRKLAQTHGREECARIMGLSVDSVNNFLSEKREQNIKVRQFTLLYETLTPEQPRIHLCYKLLETFECTHFSAKRDNYQSRCDMLLSMRSQVLHLASINKGMCFVISNRPYFESYPLTKRQIIQVGPYYLTDLLKSSTPGARELGVEIQKLRDSYSKVLNFVPKYKSLYALWNQEFGKFLKFHEPMCSSDHCLVEHNPTVFANKNNAERFRRNRQEEVSIVEFKPASAYYPIADADDIPSECLANEAGQWANHLFLGEPTVDDGDSYHVILINPASGNAELWADFIPSAEIERVTNEAKRVYPKCVCVVRSANEYPNPMTLVDECHGAVVEI